MSRMSQRQLLCDLNLSLDLEPDIKANLASANKIISVVKSMDESIIELATSKGIAPDDYVAREKIKRQLIREVSRQGKSLEVALKLLEAQKKLKPLKPKTGLS